MHSEGMKTTTNSLGETSWTVSKTAARGTNAVTFTRRNDSTGIEVVELYYPKRGRIEGGRCETMPVEAARAHLLSLRAGGWR